MAAIYSKAQVCLNGHAATADYEGFPHQQCKFCEECGQATIKACPACQNPIRGELLDSMVIGFVYEPPSFCNACGAAFPWTERKKETLIAAIDLLELPKDESEKLKQAAPDLIQDTPKTSVAAGLFGKALKKSKEIGGKVLSDVLVKVATEGALILAGLKPPA